MDYQDFIDEVEELEFIEDREISEAAVKAVLGIMVSHIDEELAYKIVRRLPDPLTMEKLRGRQTRVVPITVDEYVAEISALFKLDEDRARQVIDAVLHVAKAIAGDGEFDELRKKMPGDWADVLVNV